MFVSRFQRVVIFPVHLELAVGVLVVVLIGRIATTVLKSSFCGVLPNIFGTISTA
jgi:hypothetical protein